MQVTSASGPNPAIEPTDPDVRIDSQRSDRKHAARLHRLAEQPSFAQLLRINQPCQPLVCAVRASQFLDDDALCEALPGVAAGAPR